MARAGNDTQLGPTVRLGKNTRIGGGHALVVVAMQYEKWSRGKASCSVDRPEATQLTRPLIEILRESGATDGTDFARVLEESTWLFGPVIEVGTAAERRTTGNPRVVGGNAERDRCPGVRSDQPDAADVANVDEMVDCGTQIVDPALQRKITFARTTPAKCERERRKSDFVRDAIDQLREGSRRLPRIEWSDGKAVTEDEARKCAEHAVRPREIARKTQATREERVVARHRGNERFVLTRHRRPFPWLRVSGAGLAVTARNARCCQAVTAIARLGQRVRTETDSHFVCHDVVDHRLIGPCIEVVNELCPLVSEKPRVLEPSGALHAPKSSGSRLARMGLRRSEIDVRLAELATRDAEIGARAKANVVRYRAEHGIGDEPYAFPTYRSAEERKVWVHKWWVRPFRFFYRHLPVGLRSRIKRVAT